MHDPLSNLYAYFQNFGADYNGKTKVVEGYGELELPIIADVPFFQSLTANGAVRQTHYDISGFGSYLRANVKNSFDATAWKVSVNWEPTAVAALPRQPLARHSRAQLRRAVPVERQLLHRAHQSFPGQRAHRAVAGERRQSLRTPGEGRHLGRGRHPDAGRRAARGCGCRLTTSISR